jgi:hypothetical protein
MKRTLFAGAAAFTVMFSGQAFAQSVAVEIDPAQRATIEDYIVTKNILPAPVKGSLALCLTVEIAHLFFRIEPWGHLQPLVSSCLVEGAFKQIACR